MAKIRVLDLEKLRKRLMPNGEVPPTDLAYNDTLLDPKSVLFILDSLSVPLHLEKAIREFDGSGGKAGMSDKEKYAYDTGYSDCQDDFRKELIEKVEKI